MRTEAAGLALEGLPRRLDAQRELDASHEGVRREPGEMIRSWRCQLGITQEQLARALGVTLSTLNRWEKGRGRPSQLAWRELRGFAARRGFSL